MISNINYEPYMKHEMRFIFQLLLDYISNLRRDSLAKVKVDEEKSSIALTDFISSIFLESTSSWSQIPSQKN